MQQASHARIIILKTRDANELSAPLVLRAVYTSFENGGRCIWCKLQLQQNCAGRAQGLVCGHPTTYWSLPRVREIVGESLHLKAHKDSDTSEKELR